MSCSTFSRVVPVLAVAALLCAMYTAHRSQAQTPPAEQPTAGKVARETSPTVVFQSLDTRSCPNTSLRRSKVPGGWLIVATTTFQYSQGNGNGPGSFEAAGGLTFYPDPDHKWDGNSLP